MVLAGIEVRSLQQLEIGEPPHLVGHAAEDILEMHGGVRGHDAIDFRQYDEAVRSQQRIRNAGSALLAERTTFPLIVDLYEAAGLAHVAVAALVVMRVLKADQHVSVRQPQVGMRMHVAIHVGERSHDLRVKRVMHVEDEGLVQLMIVGEEHAARGHRVFRVMHPHGLLVRGESSHQPPVRSRSGIRVDHCEKVIALVRRRRSRQRGSDPAPRRSAPRTVRDCWRAECKNEHDQDAIHGGLHDCFTACVLQLRSRMGHGQGNDGPSARAV